jgi:hypothetical protein
MSKFCDAFSFFILNSILDLSPSPLGLGRYLTVHDNDPGEDGTSSNITSSVFGTSQLTFNSFNFDTTPTYDSLYDRFYISNTDILVSNQSATSSGTINWVTIWDNNNTPIVRVPFQSPYIVNTSDYFRLYTGRMQISVKNTGAEVASAILSCVWDSTSFNLILGNFQLALFSSITDGTEVNDSGLSRISINKTLFVPNSTPSYSYSGTATWGTSTTAGSSNAFVLLDDSNKVISYQLFPISWPAGQTLGIQANGFVLGVD